MLAGPGAVAIGLVLASTNADGAVVRDVRAIAATSATQLIVEVEGDFTWRTSGSADGGTVFLEIDGATMGDDAPRMLPVSDARVDGVIVADEGSPVRIAVDIAGRIAPHLDAAVEGSRLILTFVDGRPRAASPSKTNDSGPGTNGTGPGARATIPRDPTPPGSPGTASRESDRAARAAAGEPLAAVQARVGAHEDRTGSSRPGALTAPAAPPVASRRSVVERPVVVLDPGHGGKDPGAKAWTGEFEKDIVLDLADRIARRLRKSGEVEVVMTRSGDEFVALADRREFSQRWNADAFVSIHANASHSGAARGFTTYYHPRTTGAGKKGGDREARRLARLENGGKPAKSGTSSGSAAKSRQRTGTAATPQRASLGRAAAPVFDRRAESVQLARLVQGELVRRLEMRYEAVRDLGAKEGPFFVIGENAAPSVLVEAAFLTHREEGVRMRSEVYREQIADGVARGILAFLHQQQRSGAL